jgi:hypothetical protein
MAEEYQGWDTWAEKFKPKTNHFNGQGNLYETYGEEYEYVKSIHPNFVWTLVDGDMSSYIVAGMAYVNRIGYYITENHWQDDNDACLLSVETECECYDEDTCEGTEDCENCEGYGYVTNYL